MKRQRKALPFWWVSFAKDSDPSEFLGLVIIRGRNPEEVCRKILALGIDPGGQGAMARMPKEFDPPIAARNRCLTREEVRTLLAEYGPHLNGKPA